MPDSPTKLQRWLDVISYLAARRLPVSTEDLWAHVPAYAPGLEGSARERQTVRRMFERDKDELRELGIPIETVQYTINYGSEEVSGYRLSKRDFHLPYLALLREAGGEEAADEGGGSAGSEPHRAVPDGAQRAAPADAPASAAGIFEIAPDEAGAALDGLRELSAMPAFPLARAARSAFRKLAFDLEPAALGETPVVYARDAEAEAAGDVLRLLSGALQRRKAVTFRYRAMTSGTEEERHAHPYGLVFQHGRWYLVAHDVDRDAVRMYRVGRMERPVVNAKAPATPDYDVPADFALDAYTGRKAWELGDDTPAAIDAEVRFRFPRSLWAERNGHGERIAEEDDGGQLRRFSVRRRDPFLRWVLSLAGDAWIESPDDLAEEFRSLVRRVIDLHGPRDTDEGAR